LLPKKTGHCRALIYRYYYNDKTQLCEQFVYGGCGANENNFPHVEDCISRCTEATTQVEVQKMIKAAGPFKSLWGDFEEEEDAQDRREASMAMSKSSKPQSDAIQATLWDLAYLNWFVFAILIVCLAVFVKLYIDYRRKMVVNVNYRPISVTSVPGKSIQ